MSRAAAEIEPVSRMLWSSATLPGPMRAPESKTILILTRAMATLCHARGRSATYPGTGYKPRSHRKLTNVKSITPVPRDDWNIVGSFSNVVNFDSPALAAHIQVPPATHGCDGR
jgi:hypothetical protein